MRTTVLVMAFLSLVAFPIRGQTNRAGAAPSPPPAPPVAPAGGESIKLYRIPLTDQAVKRRMEVDGALARLRSRAALAESAVPPGGVRTRQDTDHLTTSPLSREHTGYNLIVIKF